MGDEKAGGRRRAVGTRDRVMSHLLMVGEVKDASGMASTALAEAIAYPGSSIAFAQLLSGMERSGLIEREVRGKRTYRIRLGPVAIAGPGGAGVLGGSARVPFQSAMPRMAGAAAGIAAAGGIPSAGGIPAAGTAGFDYDELARRLLVQVVRRLAATDPEASQPAPSELQETVTGLEYELATAWTKHGKLAEENVRLREQLSAAQRSLAQAAERVRKLPVSTGLDSSEVVLLQRLLTSAETADSPDDSGASAETTSLAG